MSDSRNFLSAKGKYVVGLLLLVCISGICAAFGMTDSDDFGIARREILLRRIGHELLRQSGDSTSRVLPVKKIAENDYRISFENDLTFQTDSLVNTTRRLLAQDPLARDYVVNVLNCTSTSVAYGYAISKDTKADIVACLGRRQPKACYVIEIKFKPTAIVEAKKEYFLGALSLLAVVGFLVLRPFKPRKGVPNDQHDDRLALGLMVFDTQNRKLVIHGKTIDLTKTETRVLRIFARSPNEIIERSRLQKEIWEDEGVVVGRSLDMFISKLRKKLELDPNVKIVVIRGKGYRIEIGG